LSTYYPDLETFRRLAAASGRVPVFRRLMADRMTPVSAFAALSHDAERAFLLESVVGGEKIARYSFVGAEPSVVFTAKRDAAAIQRADGSVEVLGKLADPLAALTGLLGTDVGARRDSRTSEKGGLSTTHPTIALPRFMGGAVGYAGYDTVRYYENLPDSPRDDRELDDLDFGIYDTLAIFDHVNKTLLVVAQADASAQGGDAAYRTACERIDDMVGRLKRTPPNWQDELALDARPEIAWTSTFEKRAFEAAVRKAKEYIVAGDIFQVVLSQRLRVHTRADPFNIYRALRVVNPSPFMFYLKSRKCTLVGASPEILCRVEDGVVTNRPLAGTRRRGSTPQEDARLERELLADPKDCAEHIMLVDLGRNDVGRVAQPGSVKLNELMTIERYSHVMHISSNLTGRLAEGKTAIDALKSCLPVGTVSGAPKIRAMQIIDELEPTRRGPYGGAVGYFDLSGNMDMCIALRTMVVTPDSAGGGHHVDIQAGAGIVMDSDPAAEYEETLNKAKAMLAAVAIAAG
jgi:anthranilate synthase component I